MPIISISEAQSRLSDLVSLIAQTGESYLITANGNIVAELQPFVAKPTPGRYRDQISFDDDAFEPLNDDADG